MSQTIKVGQLTLALGLILLGIGLLAYNFGGLSSPQNVWRFWPLLLVGLGAEYFFRRILFKDAYVVFHLPSALLIGFVILAGIVVNALPAAGISQALEEMVFSDRFNCTRQWRSDPVIVEEGAWLHLENDRGGTYKLRPSDDGKLHAYADITVWAPSEAKAKEMAENIEVVIEKGSVTRVYTRNLMLAANNHESINLTLEVPSGLNIELDSENGAVEVEKIAAFLSVRTANSSVAVDGLAGKLEVKSENGKVTVRNCSGTAAVCTVNGEIMVDNPLGEVLLDSENGLIKLSSMSPLDKLYSVRSSNGSINFSLPKVSSLEIEARTSYGKISGMGEAPANAAGWSAGSANLMLGSGKGKAQLTSENGHIAVYVI